MRIDPFRLMESAAKGRLDVVRDAVEQMHFDVNTQVRRSTASASRGQ